MLWCYVQVQVPVCFRALQDPGPWTLSDRPLDAQCLGSLQPLITLKTDKIHLKAGPGPWKPLMHLPGRVSWWCAWPCTILFPSVPLANTAMILQSSSASSLCIGNMTKTQVRMAPEGKIPCEELPGGNKSKVKDGQCLCTYVGRTSRTGAAADEYLLT